jgi:hypothetical protein
MTGNDSKIDFLRSGAMVTLELARAWSESGLVPHQKLRLAWWTAEGN